MTRIIFVYNADSGIVNGLLDAAHKVLRPATYPCGLCRVTYGLVTQKRAWRLFIASLPIPAVFVHRDELRLLAPQHAAGRLPAVYLDRAGGDLELLASADDFDEIRDLDELQQLVSGRLAPALP